MKSYNDWSEFCKDFPAAAEILIWENKQQFPNAKFFKAVVGQQPLPYDQMEESVILFELEGSDLLLLATIPEPSIDEDVYIDEYQDLPKKEALDWFNIIV